MQLSLNRVGIEKAHQIHILQEHCSGTSDHVRYNVINNLLHHWKYIFFIELGISAKLLLKDTQKRLPLSLNYIT